MFYLKNITFSSYLHCTYSQKMPPNPLSLYVGVEHVAAHSTTFTSAILKWFTGDIVGDSDVNCTNIPKKYVSSNILFCDIQWNFSLTDSPEKRKLFC